jgi:hypothetical protein
LTSTQSEALIGPFRKIAILVGASIIVWRSEDEEVQFDIEAIAQMTNQTSQDARMKMRNLEERQRIRQRIRGSRKRRATH